MTELDSFVTVGRSGLRVSPLSLGTMTFGEDSGWGSTPEVAHAILAEYLERGGNVVDTANIYTNGHSEKIVGDYFADRAGARDRVVLSTKFYATLHPGDPNAGGAGRKAMVASLEDSLRRLRTDYVDLLWLHALDPRVPLDETLRALDDLVAVGKVRYIGVCNLPAWVASRAQTIAQFRSWSPVTAMQIEYSLIERTAEGELLPMATELGIGVMPYSPLRGGRLSGKYKRDGNIPDSARAVILDRPTAEEWTVIDAVSDVAAELDVTPAQVALAWVAGRNAVTSTIIGARTQEQLRSNLASLAITLTPQQRHTLDAASSPTLDHPASVNAGPGPQMGFGGSTVDGVHRPTWGTLTNSAIRY
jgi:aryl-alcohol dehydrogenase-like predicted oxidoreductase